MAENSTKKGATSPTGSRKSSPMGLGVLVLVVILTFMFLPTFIFLTVSLMPTLVALVVDRTPQRYGAITVGGLNFSGCFPWLIDLWLHDHTVTYVLTLLTNVWALFVIFGCASLGWILSSTAPSLASNIMAVTSTQKIAALQERQRILLDEWGPEVIRADTGQDILKSEIPEGD